MSNGIAITPIDLVFDYRPVTRRLHMKPDKWIGFCCSFFVHASLLIVGGILFIKPVEFAVDQGLSGMEVQLVAGTQEPVVIKTPDVQPETVQEIKPLPEQIVEPEKVITPEPAKPLTVGNSPVSASFTGQGAETEVKPVYLRNPAPRYPLEARRNNWEGTVILKAFVDKNGYPVRMNIEKSSGHEVLDESALKTVKTWQFRPARIGKMAVESSVQIPVRFELKN